MNVHSSTESRLRFTLEAEDTWSRARATSFETAHGTVQTPIFMPVATRAALRGIDTALVEQMGFQVLLANTYHLLLRPGPAIFEQMGGIHRFMNWPRSVLTDSGGFQIFSLARQLTLSEEGARFRSYVDGKQIVLTPEISIGMQRSIGSDIMMVLDHCIDSTSDEQTTRAALELTTRWARRSYAARGESPQALFGIVQGACFPELRRQSAQQICEIPFDGFAIGGLAVGETKSEREDMVEFTAPLLPADRPRYLMGVGTPIDLLEAVKRGVDMFDCIIPTAFAHQGVCFTSNGKVDLKRGIFKSCEDRLDSMCTCSTCERFSRAYLHHLIRSGEFIAGQLCSVHNLTFYRQFMASMRASILSNTFKEFYTTQRERVVADELDYVAVPPKVRKKISPFILGAYEAVIHPSGYGSIKHRDSGEVMHSVLSPSEEALSLYIDQAGILECVKSPGEDLVIWDVGLGAATNSMTLILELEKVLPLARSVRVLSFERDLDPLRLALRHPGPFAHLRHAAPHALLAHGSWKHLEAQLSWTLVTGDIRDTLRGSQEPDIIWYDPFSYKVNAELWTVLAFEQLLSACGDRPTRLYTYTASTAVRAAMLAAGWFVGVGRGTGPKSETTVAFAERATLANSDIQLLGPRWLERWERSDSKFPAGIPADECAHKIRMHPQFSSPRST